MAESSAMKRLIPSLSDDAVVIDWSMEVGARTAGGASIIIARDVLELRALGLTKPETLTAAINRDRTKR